jgi:hypothetical protein
MEYGAHVDAALMGDATLFRTDVSLTLFLNEPADYDGGELALESGSGELRVKLPARALVCYPTGQLHRVTPVTRGERLVVVSWIQSHVRDGGAREVLRDLALALEKLPQDATAAIHEKMPEAQPQVARAAMPETAATHIRRQRCCGDRVFPDNFDLPRRGQGRHARESRPPRCRLRGGPRLL